MGLLDVLRMGVRIADTVTKDLQPKVTYQRYMSTNSFGKKVHDTPGVLLDAIVDWKRSQVRTNSGDLTVSRVVMIFLDINQVVAATNGDGFQEDDKFILSDGTTGPILDLSGFIDRVSGIPLATEVLLG